MKFSIITPTYQRPDKLIRALKSVLDQNFNDWEMIIVNDSPDFDYNLFNIFLEKNKERINNRVRYFINDKNKGVNYSRNFALDKIDKNTDYFTFLDDDDWLNQQTLLKAKEIIEKYPNKDWYVSNRAFSDGRSLTKNNILKESIDYLWDYLITKRFKGDATHFISTKYKNKRFSSIKNAEEWFFFIQLSKCFLYYNFNSSFTEGYDSTGLNNSIKKKKRLKNTFTLFKESVKYNLLNYKLLLYFVLRILAIILK